MFVEPIEKLFLNLRIILSLMQQNAISGLIKIPK